MIWFTVAVFLHTWLRKHNQKHVSGMKESEASYGNHTLIFCMQCLK